MEHRGVEYRIIQGIKRGFWKWSASVARTVVSGQEPSKAAADVSFVSVTSSSSLLSIRAKLRPRSIHRPPSD
jgi:hypothetical protein